MGAISELSRTGSSTERELTWSSPGVEEELTESLPGAHREYTAISQRASQTDSSPDWELTGPVAHRKFTGSS